MSELESGLPWSSSGGRLGFEGSKALKKDPLLTCKSRIDCYPTKPTCRQCKHGQILLHTLSHPLARLSLLGCHSCRSRETWRQIKLNPSISPYQNIQCLTSMSGAGSDQQSQVRRRPGRREPHSRESSSWLGRWVRAPGCSESASGFPPRSAPHPLSPCIALQTATPENFEKLSCFFSHLLSPPS